MRAFHHSGHLQLHTTENARQTLRAPRCSGSCSRCDRPVLRRLRSWLRRLRRRIRPWLRGLWRRIWWIRRIRTWIRRIRTWIRRLRTWILRLIGDIIPPLNAFTNPSTSRYAPCIKCKINQKSPKTHSVANSFMLK